MPALVTRREEVRSLRLARGQPETTAELTKFLSELASRVVDSASAEPQVRERLGHSRHRVLAVDYREDKPAAGERPIRLAEVGFYDYDHDVLVVAVVDPFAGKLVELYERKGVAPPIVAEELAEARALVAKIAKMREALARRRARIAAFPTPTYAFVEGSGREGHRGCTVYVEAKNGTVLQAVVDLSARQLVPDKDLHETLRRGRRAADRTQRRA
jgi:hypothetical protein